MSDLRELVAQDRHIEDLGRWQAMSEQIAALQAALQAATAERDKMINAAKSAYAVLQECKPPAGDTDLEDRRAWALFDLRAALAKTGAKEVTGCQYVSS